MVASASELAAVPLKTKYTSHSVSNSSRRRSHTSRVSVVVAVGRQPALVGRLQRIERFGADPAVLSLANWVRQPGKVCFMGACGVRAGCGKP